jgi:ribosomal-protein-serine acetyltransferase
MEPILLNVPRELTTPRLLLRIPRFDDGAIINPAIVESAAELAQWVPWASPTPKVDDTEQWVRGAAAKFLTREQFHFLIFLKDSGEYVGTCGIHRHDWKIPMFEIGYWLRTSRVGSGYMVEAVKAVTAFALDALKANRVEVRCDDLNARSCRVAERAGFTLEGVHRNSSRDHRDSLRDTRIYALLPPKK